MSKKLTSYLRIRLGSLLGCPRKTKEVLRQGESSFDVDIFARILWSFVSFYKSGILKKSWKVSERNGRTAV